MEAEAISSVEEEECMTVIEISDSERDVRQPTNMPPPPPSVVPPKKKKLSKKSVHSIPAQKPPFLDENAESHDEGTIDIREYDDREWVHLQKEIGLAPLKRNLRWKAENLAFFWALLLRIIIVSLELSNIMDAELKIHQMEFVLLVCDLVGKRSYRNALGRVFRTPETLLPQIADFKLRTYTDKARRYNGDIFRDIVMFYYGSEDFHYCQAFANQGRQEEIFWPLFGRALKACVTRLLDLQSKLDFVDLKRFLDTNKVELQILRFPSDDGKDVRRYVQGVYNILQPSSFNKSRESVYILASPTPGTILGKRRSAPSNLDADRAKKPTTHQIPHEEEPLPSVSTARQHVPNHTANKLIEREAQLEARTAELASIRGQFPAEEYQEAKRKFPGLQEDYFRCKNLIDDFEASQRKQQHLLVEIERLKNQIEVLRQVNGFFLRYLTGLSRVSEFTDVEDNLN